MARQVLPIAGAVVGTFFGNPQLGFAIGSIIGNAVDPQTIRAPGLKELPVMGVTEGAYRQVVYGTSVIRDCQLIDWGDIDVVTVKERQGKGGGPVVETKRLYQTYAVGLGEPVQAIRYIKRNGVMVYDVRAGSKILRESTAFAKRFRFYPGSETQLPDPSLEALPRNGVGNTPAYRGSAYFVMIRDDLTDLGGQIPTYEVEVLRTIAGEIVDATLVTSVSTYAGDPSDLKFDDDLNATWASSTDHVRVSPNGEYAAGVHREGGVGQFRILKQNVGAGTWSVLSTPSGMPTGFINAIAWSPDSSMLALSVAVGDVVGVALFVRSGDTFTRQADAVDPLPNSGGRALAFDSVGARIAISNASSLDGLYVYDISGGALVNRRKLSGIGTNSIGGAPERVEFQPGAGSNYLACANGNYTFVVKCEQSPMDVVVDAATGGQAGVFWDATGGFITAVGDAAVRVYEFLPIVSAEKLNLQSTYTTGIFTFCTDASITSDKRFIAISATSGQNWPIVVGLSDAAPPVVGPTYVPPTSGFMVRSVSFSDSSGLPEYSDSSVTLSAIVDDIADRCGIPSGKLSLGELTDTMRGVTLGGAYDGAGAITTMMPAFLFDQYEADRKLFAPKRGAAVKATITASHLIEEPDENTLRGQGIEYPRSLQLKYLNPGQNYAAPATTVTNKTTSPRVRGEVQIDLPVSFDETEALNVAARMLKVMWEDVNGEAVFSLPAGPFAWLTPTDTLGLSLRGALYRVRVEKVEQSGGRLKITARRDRQSAYTSTLTAIPLPAPAPPPPSLAGATTFVAMNIPGRVDSDDQLGFVFAMCGLPGTAWQGANLAYRISGGTDWTSLGNFTTRAVMGTLATGLSDASEFYPDNTNVLKVTLIGDDQLETITEAQFLSEGNPAAIVYPNGTAEILQFKNVADVGSRTWNLTRLQRGRLGTVPGPHRVGARFVMLGGSEFVALPSSLIGLALQFRVTSIGTSPEVAPVYDFTWSPVHSQREFKPAHLTLIRAGSTITAAAVPRHRFGTEDSPVASAECTGYRFTATDGANTLTTDTAAVTPTAAINCTGWATPITVTVAMLNRYTGAGPTLSESIV